MMSNYYSYSRKKVSWLVFWHSDFIDFEKNIIYELKPNNPQQIGAGTKQLQGYLNEVGGIYGPGWKTVLDLYKPESEEASGTTDHEVENSQGYGSRAGRYCCPEGQYYPGLDLLLWSISSVLDADGISCP